jgi:micrococcal nuclease
MRSKNKIMYLFVLIAAFFVFLSSGAAQENDRWHFNSDDAKFERKFGRTYNYNDIKVKRVIDGDTLLLESGDRVRLIGIDTPEIHESKKLYRDAERSKEDIKTIQEMGRRAMEFTKNLVEGKRVRLELDVEKHDQYNRILAYVYLVDSGIFVNAKIVEEGYASVATYPPNVKYADEFVRLNREARENNRGLWK